MSRPNYYEALSLTNDASSEQVEKAYHFFASMYDDAAVATYSLLDADEQRDVRAHIRQAYEVLRDPEQRQRYDHSLAERPPASEEPKPAPFEPRPQPVPETRPLEPQAATLALRFLPEPVTGESLRRAREERRVSLREIAGATKIGVRFLEYIEADRHGDLPAVVYIRGFVQQYARCIGLDPRQTADSYLKRVRT